MRLFHTVAFPRFVFVEGPESGRVDVSTCRTIKGIAPELLPNCQQHQPTLKVRRWHCQSMNGPCSRLVLYCEFSIQVKEGVSPLNTCGTVDEIEVETTAGSCT